MFLVTVLHRDSQKDFYEFKNRSELSKWLINRPKKNIECIDVYEGEKLDEQSVLDEYNAQVDRMKNTILGKLSAEEVEFLGLA